MMSADRDPPVFVVGCFRGGTTLVERLLLMRPEVFGPGYETQLFSRIRYGRPVDHPGELAVFSAGAADTTDPVERFLAGVEARVSRASARCWIEKTPEHLYHVHALRKRFRDARIISVTRDGRDVAVSVLHTEWMLPGVKNRLARIVGGAVLWELMSLEAMRLREDPSLQDALVDIHYEDLVRDPERELTRLARFLELPASKEDMAQWLDATQRVEGNSLIDPSVGGISPSPVGRWRDSQLIGEREVAVIQELIGGTLRRAGYDLATVEAPATPVRAAAWALKAAWFGRRLQRYPASVSRGIPRHIAADARTAFAPCLGFVGART